MYRLNGTERIREIFKYVLALFHETLSDIVKLIAHVHPNHK